MLAFEAIEQLGYPDLAFEFNGKTKEEAAELCKIHGIAQCPLCIGSLGRIRAYSKANTKRCLCH